MDSTGLYKVAYGPALRRIIDFAEPEGGISINPTGQSGVANSPHYDDQAKMYVEGKFRRELMNRGAIEKVETGRMVIKPK